MVKFVFKPSVATSSGLLFVTALYANAAFATNGYFSHGYGAKSKGRAGASTALPQDALVAATNPAGIRFVEDRIDVGLDIFKPKRGGKIQGNFFGPDASFDGSQKETFYIPDFGYVAAINDHWSWAFTAIGHGGMNTRYNASENPYARYGSEGRAGVDLAQLFLGPTLAFEYTAGQSVGLSVNYVFQQFEATGLSAFAGQSFPGPYSNAPDNVTDNGHNSSTGFSARLGWQGNFGPISVGAGWAPKVHMSRFKRYKGLFAEQGGFDIPETYAVGLAWRATTALTVAVDYQRIKYAEVASVGNSIQNFQNPGGSTAFLAELPADQVNDLLAGLNAGPSLLTLLDALQNSPLGGTLEGLSEPLADARYGNRLGGSNGPGFGWRNMSVVKLGVDYVWSPALTLRAGYSDTEQPVPEDETFFNILAPGVVEKHYTLGATFSRGAHELTTHVLYAPTVTVKGNGSIPGDGPPIPPTSFGGGEADVYLNEKTLGISYGYKFD